MASSDRVPSKPTRKIDMLKKELKPMEAEPKDLCMVETVPYPPMPGLDGRVPSPKDSLLFAWNPHDPLKGTSSSRTPQ